MVARRHGQSLCIEIVERQRVERQVIWAKSKGRLEGAGPGVEGLAWDVVQQVEADARDPGPASLGHGVDDVRCRVSSAERSDLPIDHRLRSDRKSGDARSPPIGGATTLRGSWVRLEGDLGVRRQPEPFPGEPDQILDGPRTEQRRGATPEIDTPQRRPAGCPRWSELRVRRSGSKDDLGLQSGDKRIYPVPWAPSSSAGVHHEIAVGAAGHAERNVEVKRIGRRGAGTWRRVGHHAGVGQERSLTTRQPSGGRRSRSISSSSVPRHVTWPA